jgi:hypothetical protein
VVSQTCTRACTCGLGVPAPVHVHYVVSVTQIITCTCTCNTTLHIRCWLKYNVGLLWQNTLCKFIKEDLLIVCYTIICFSFINFTNYDIQCFIVKVRSNREKYTPSSSAKFIEFFCKIMLLISFWFWFCISTLVCLILLLLLFMTACQHGNCQ